MLINIKSTKEIEKFTEVGRITAEIMNKIKNNLKVGVSGHDIDSLVKSECEERGAIPAFLGYKGFPGACCFSTNNILVHGIPNNTKLKF